METAGSTTTPDTGSNWRPKVDAYEASLERATDAAARFVSEVSKGGLPGREAFANETRVSGYWLTFLGACGCGKTMLARQIFEEASKYNPGKAPLWITGTGTYRERDRRPRNVFLTATEFADLMKSGRYDLPEDLGLDFLVVIDDIGAARDTTSFIAEGIYRLANARLGRWTVFTSNLLLPDVAKNIDERVASRLIRDDNVLVQIKAGDYAMRKR